MLQCFPCVSRATCSVLCVCVWVPPSPPPHPPQTPLEHLTRGENRETISRHIKIPSSRRNKTIRQESEAQERKTMFTLAFFQRCSNLLTVGQVCSSQSIDLHIRGGGGGGSGWGGSIPGRGFGQMEQIISGTPKVKRNPASPSRNPERGRRLHHHPLWLKKKKRLEFA